MATIDILDSINDRVDDLSLLSPVASRLLAIVGKDDFSLKEVVKVVENDASLTVRILRVANSAAFYRGQPITTLFRAVMQLGMRMVVSVTIGSCTNYIMSRDLKGYNSYPGELWEHCLRTAIASREFSVGAVKPTSKDLAFTAGLLHDIGKSIISDFLEGNEEVVQQLNKPEEGRDFLQVERTLLGTDHAEVGALVALKWRLPDSLVESIRHHHAPAEADEEFRELVYSVHLGDLLAMLSGSGTGMDTLAYRLDENYEKYLNISKQDITRTISVVQGELSKVKSSVFIEDTN